MTYTVPIHELVNLPTTNYKVIKVPIRFNQKYTIALDSSSEVILMPVILKNDRFVHVYTSNKADINLTESLKEQILIFSSTQYLKPFTYEVTMKADHQNNQIFDAEYLANNEDNLYLLIQIAQSNESTVTILEGDYTKVNTNNKDYYDVACYPYFSSREQNSHLLSRLSLLLLNTKVNYAFSDRLIEFLTWHAISNLEKIDENIMRVEAQGIVQSMTDLTPGVWNDYIRLAYFRQMMSEKQIEHRDLTGYIDRDTDRQCIRD